MSIHGVLGKTTSYPKVYSPQVLYPIARSLERAKLSLSVDKLSLGMDWWQAFELSWLNPQGVSQVAMARFAIPANSPFIVESKSLKLYLNGLNFTMFESWQQLQATIEKDLSTCLQTKVAVELFTLDSLNCENNTLDLESATGECVDHVLNGLTDSVELCQEVTPEFLAVYQGHDDTIKNQSLHHQVYYSNLLRSNCPVTNQPDWGTLQIKITSVMIDKVSLLKYILSFRQHNGFHEQCVEQIFSDLSQKFCPDSLMVRAWYTRRGGIDINPCRVSDISLLPKPSRLVRQ